MFFHHNHCYFVFLLTRPSRDVTIVRQLNHGHKPISTHTSLAGRDGAAAPLAVAIGISTHTSLAGRDGIKICRYVCAIIISTHTSLAGRDSLHANQCCTNPISTHTSLAGRDAHDNPELVSIVISTHTSLAGRDIYGSSFDSSFNQFLLTRPSRDVTFP